MLFSKLLCTVVATAAISLNPIPYYDFSNGCSGLINIGLPAYLCKQASFGGVVYQLSSLTHQVLRIAPDENGIVQCSVQANLPTGLGGVNLGGSFSLGMAVDPSGRVYVSNTGTGPTTLDWGSVWSFDLDEPAPALAQRFWNASSQSGLPSGLIVDWRHDQLLISSETDASIYYSALDQSADGVWASALTDPTEYALLQGTSGIPGNGGTIDNSNLFGAPFGPVASSISNNGKSLYVGSADRGLLLAIEINNDGTAGGMRTVGSSPQHTVEGVFYDNRKSRVYFGSVFRNGTNLTPDGPNGEYNGGVLAGNSIWEVSGSGGTASRFYDSRLGSVCSVDGAKGVLNQGQKKLFVVSSGFDSLPAWPLGLVRLGTQPYPSGGVNPSTIGPALTNAYNGKIWIVNTD